MAQNEAKDSVHFGAFRRVIGPSTVCLSMLAMLLGGCGDASLVGVGEGGYQEQTQTISLVPEFSLNGSEDMPDTVYFSELGLSIAEIRLEPLTSSADDAELSSIIYSTRNAIQLDFDVARGEQVIFGEPLELPHTGRYLISVRLEPISRVQSSYGTVNEVSSPSFRVEGFVATDPATRTERGRLDESADGSPTPMPFEEDEECEIQQGLDGRAGEWTPFHYDSRQSVFISLNEVEIGEDSEFLSFEFNMNEWAKSLAIPLQDAVQGSEEAASNSSAHGVDVTSRLEDDGYGASTLLTNARVSSLNQRR